MDAAAAKRALSAFVAACRATAAVATVTLAVSTAGCMGVPANWEIDNARDATQTDPQPTTQPVPTPGGIKAVQVTEDIVTGEPAFQRIEEE